MILGLFRTPPLVSEYSAERLRGLMALSETHSSDLAALDELGIEIGDWWQELQREGLMRRLLLEGRTLGRYVLATRPSGGVARRYARALLADADREPLALPSVVHRFPRLLRFIEPSARGSARVVRRLNLATAIVEMTPAGAQRFHEYEERPWLAVSIALSWGLVLESLLFVPRRLLGRLVFRR